MTTRMASLLLVLTPVLLPAACPAPGAAQTTRPEAATPTPTPTPTPKQLWERCRKTLPPLRYDTVADEVVASDTDPRLKLRRMEVRFISQVIEGHSMGHDAVIYLPADPKVNAPPERRGKVVIVARPFGDKTLIGNYAEPIAARTGYPTMCVVLPGDRDGKPGEMPWLTGLRKLASETHDPMNFDLFRCAVPYLRAMDVMADVLDEPAVRAIIGGHSKRAYYAYTAAAIDPRRVAGVVYMGCERLFETDEKYPDLSVSPRFAEGEKYPRSLVPFTLQKYVKCPVFYIGATNEAGFTMFGINRFMARMERPWTIEFIPNYRHAAGSEKQFIDWQMWVAHVFDRRPLTKIGDLAAEKKGRATVFRARVDSPNKILQVKLWYVWCDDVPYWRDLMWYPVLMRDRGDGRYEANIGGNPPDAWFVEVKDTAQGFPGYVSSLPMNLTGKPAEERNARRPRYWGLRTDLGKKLGRTTTFSPEAYGCFLDGEQFRKVGQRKQAITAYKKAIALDPEFALAHWKMGLAFGRGTAECRKRAEAIGRAMVLAQRLSAKDRWAAQADYGSMTRYRYALAIEAYGQLLRLDPGDVAARRGLGTMYYDVEQWDKAAAEFRRVIELGDAGPGAYMRLAMAHINPGKYDEAQRVLEECLARGGEHVNVYLTLARVHQYRGEYDQALAIVKEAIGRWPDAASCRAEKGNIYLYRGDLERAEAEYQKLLDDPRPAFADLGLYRMSELRLLQGRYEAARELAARGYDVARKRGRTGLMRDRLSLSAAIDAVSGHSVEAIEKQDALWQTTLEDEELEWQRFVVYCKGLIHAEAGQIDRALAEARILKKLIAKGVDQDKMRLWLHLMGVVELERKNYRQAAEHLEKSLPMTCVRSRLNIAVLDSLAAAYQGMGEMDKARQQYERMAKFPRGRQYYGHLWALRLYRLGRIHEAQGQPAKAARCYREFLDLWRNADPGIPERGEAQRRLAKLAGQ